MTDTNELLKTGGGVDHLSSYLFHLEALPSNQHEGGNLRGANEENWPVLVGQNGAVYLIRLEPGGVREPHWHPNAWEINYVISGSAKWVILGTQQENYTFEARKGDVVFAPQGFFHYFENASDNEELVVFIVFNSSTSEAYNDIGIVNSISLIPNDILATLFGVSPDFFNNLPKIVKPVTIVKKRSSHS
ncbi:MAG: cupin domain-containing protein [Nostoc sp.]|uniref:cupin domain-containing protein n=1 Tax=unclassified Nostoc TaxID=2593658 RepID=UPI001D9491AC|nr:cupin domain-containing protein [Nostoc sp. JL34]MBN3882797.1 cupin domain-containing protein [Nostoc sp. JL34]